MPCETLATPLLNVNRSHWRDQSVTYYLNGPKLTLYKILLSVLFRGPETDCNQCNREEHLNLFGVERAWW